MKQILFVVCIAAAICPQLFAQCPTVHITKHTDTVCGFDGGGTYDVTAISNVQHGPRYRVRWTTSGTGTFFDTHSLSTTYEYSSGDAGLGYVWLKITITDRQHVCRRVSDSLYLKLDDPARISLDPDQLGLEVCGNDPVFLDGGISGRATTVYWSTSGTGYFSVNPSPTTTYYPSFQDRFNGYVSITGMTDDPPGPCPADYDYLNITFMGAVANAGKDTILCGSRFGGSFPVNAITNSPKFVSKKIRVIKNINP